MKIKWKYISLFFSSIAHFDGLLLTDAKKMFYQGIKILRFSTQSGRIWYVKKSYLGLVVVMSYDLKCEYDMCIFLVLKKEKKLFLQKKIAIFDLDSL